MNKGLLTGAYTYLVGPLEYAEDGFSWRVAISEALKDLGVKTFDPNKDHFVNLPTESQEDRELLKKKRENGDWKAVTAHMKSVIQRDLRMVDLSSFIIANIEPFIPTFGSVHELVVASQQNKAILVMTSDKSKFPLWLAGMLNMDLVFDNWNDLMEYIRGIHFEKIYADPKYWKIISHE